MLPFNSLQAEQYLEELRQDGWEIKHQYEENDPFFTATKEGFKIMIDCRLHPNATITPTFSKGILARIHAWGPDEIAIEPPFPYEWLKFKEAVFICEFCGKKVDKTYRVGFANRSCANCLPKARQELEKSGWCD
jgi:hypothetical protein